MKWIPLVSVCVAGIGLAPVAQTQTSGVPRSIDDVVNAALQRNGEYLAIEQRIQEAQGLLRQAGVRPNPTVEIETAQGSVLGSGGEAEYTAGFFQPLETGGKRNRRIEVARIGIDLARTELVERKRQLLFDVQTHYAEVLAARERVATLEKLLEVNRENFRLTNARVEKGDAAPLERQLLSVELQRSEAQRATFGGKLASSILELKRVAGFRAEQSIDVDAPFNTSGPAAALEELKKRAIANRPDLQAAELIGKQAAGEADLARANASPDVTLSAKYSRRDSKFDQLGVSTASGGLVPIRDQSNLLVLGISLPIFTKNRTRGDVEAATAREAAAKLRSDFLRQSIGTEVEAAYARWQAAHSGQDTLRIGVLDQSAENVAIIQQAYRLGQLRLLDVLNEQRRLLDSHLTYIDAVAEQARSFAELQRAVGGDLR